MKLSLLKVEEIEQNKNLKPQLEHWKEEPVQHCLLYRPKERDFEVLNMFVC